jgi:peptidoglycan-associated lipoprotein
VHYRDFWFDAGSSNIRTMDNALPGEIADYLKNNPTLVVGLDNHSGLKTMALTNNRVDAIKTALINAGVPAEKIKVGSFGDEKLHHDGKVEILLMTGS